VGMLKWMTVRRAKVSEFNAMMFKSSAGGEEALLSYLDVSAEAIQILLLGLDVINLYYAILTKCLNARAVTCSFGMNPTAASALSRCRYLTKFKCIAMDGLSLVALVDAAPGLQEVFWFEQDGTKCTRDQLLSISRLHSLRTIETVEGSFAQYPDVLHAVGVNCQHLEDLTLGDVSCEGLLALSQGCPMLRILTLIVRDNLTSNVLHSMAQHWSELHSLTVWVTRHTVWCDAIEDGLVEMLRRCLHLTDVHCTCVDSSDAGSLNDPTGSYGPRANAELVPATPSMAIRVLIVHGLRLEALREVCSHSPALCAYKQALPITAEALRVLAGSAVAALCCPATLLCAADLAPLRNLHCLGLWDVRGVGMEPAIAALAQRSPLLFDLEVYFATPPQLHTLGTIARSCPRLSTLQYISADGTELGERAAAAVESLVRVLCPGLGIISV
jgi:hypothetical protein